jgi:hypothetical protein
MSIQNLFRIFACVAASSCLAGVALGANFSFTGSFVRDDEHRAFTFQVLTASTVTIRTWSYAGGTNAAGQVIPRGGLDPFISIFDSTGTLIAQNDDGPGVAVDPHTGAGFDSLISQVFAPGNYLVILTQSDNQPNGGTLAAGFSEDGNPTFTTMFGCGAPMFCDITPDARNPNWALDIVNANAAISPVPGAYQISYATNVGNGASFINLTNAGTIGGQDPTGDICANVYVFDPAQELVECCTCLLTPNHLRTLSVRDDLTGNNLTPGLPSSVTVALLASNAAGGPCDAASVTTPGLVSGLQAWGTTSHQAPGGGFQVTETPFQAANISLGELQKMTATCGFIEANGSKFGVCKACRDGAQGAAHR